MVKWTPISPIDDEKVFCLDLANCMHDDFFSKSHTKDEEIEYTCQIALQPRYIAEKIDMCGKGVATT